MAIVNYVLKVRYKKKQNNFIKKAIFLFYKLFCGYLTGDLHKCFSPLALIETEIMNATPDRLRCGKGPDC